MAHYFLFPEKDTTIYSHTSREFLNTGIDEVLTLRDEPSSTDLNYYPSRILIQFKQSEINDGHTIAIDFIPCLGISAKRLSVNGFNQPGPILD